MAQTKKTTTTRPAAKASGRNVTVKIKAAHDYRPKYAHKGDAAADLKAYLSSPVRVPKGGSATVGTGVSMSVPEGYVGLVFGRSGLGCKQGIRPANCVGVIDSGYRGEIMVTLHNDSKYDFEVYDKDRIAQLMIVELPKPHMTFVDELDDTERGSDGYGSTGVR